MTLAFSETLNDMPTAFVELIWRSLLRHNLAPVDAYNRAQSEYLAKFGQPWYNPVGLHPAGDIAKDHTIRRDENHRWQPGKMIHFIVNNRSPRRFQFAPLVPVVKVQPITFEWQWAITGANWQERNVCTITVEGRLLGTARTDAETGKVMSASPNVHTLARRDGFKDVQGFLDYFKEDFRGRIIHWTNQWYDPSQN